MGNIAFHWVTLSLSYVLLAMGMTLSLSISRIVNLAHGSFYILGGFLFIMFLKTAGVPYGWSLLASLVILGLVGALLEAKIYRPLGGVLAPSIICMAGVLLAIEGLIVLIFGSDLWDVPSYFTGTVNLGDTVLSIERIVMAIVALLLIAGLYYFLSHVRLGKAFKATAQDREAATLMGINVGLVSSLSMGIGAALAGLAAIQITAVYYLSPFISYAALMTAFLVVSLGGMGSILGVVVGAFIIGFVDSFGALWVGTYYHLIGFALIIIIFMVRPQGLFGVPIKD